MGSQRFYAKPKKIQVIGTPKSIGQAKIAGTIIEKISSENSPIYRKQL